MHILRILALASVLSLPALAQTPPPRIVGYVLPGKLSGIKAGAVGQVRPAVFVRQSSPTTATLWLITDKDADGIDNQRLLAVPMSPAKFPGTYHELPATVATTAAVSAPPAAAPISAPVAKPAAALIPAGGIPIWKVIPADAPSTVLDPTTSRSNRRSFPSGETWLEDVYFDRFVPDRYYRGQTSIDQGVTWRNISLDPSLDGGTSANPNAVFSGDWLARDAGGYQRTSRLTPGGPSEQPNLWRILDVGP